MHDFRERVCAIARSWDGTPIKHQASCKGVGCDCKGFIWGIAREIGLPSADEWHARLANYPVLVPVGLLREGLEACFDEAETPSPGDVLLLEIGQPRKAQHLAVYLGWETSPNRERPREQMIHANPDIGRVFISTMRSGTWERVNSIWSWRQEGLGIKEPLIGGIVNPV